jgi:hypothetical protein
MAHPSATPTAAPRPIAATMLARLAASLLCTLASLAPPQAHGATPHPSVQRQLIGAAVARMAPSPPGQAAVYYLGFAGYGEQKVFRKEEELATSVLGARFGSTGRSLQLVNDIHDRKSYPLASYENFHVAVQEIGRRMNRERDVLVLMLTSHGSRQDGIAVTNGRLIDDALSPADVRKALDEARIRWRVIVVSACYSGIFIPKLKSDTTLIITAADARHSSFGCADDRDLTWFGEALLQDSVPHACSLPAAFEQTSRLIHRRESEQREIHSNPLMNLGPRMGERLAQLYLAPAGCR